jgi:hypothetical protein
MRRNHGRRKITPSHFTANSGDLTADTGFARDNWIGVLPQTIQLTMSSNVPCGERCFGGSALPKENVWTVFPGARSQRLERLFFCASVSLSVAPGSTAPICPPIDTFPSFDWAVLEIGPGGAVYAGPIGEDAKLWRER